MKRLLPFILSSLAIPSLGLAQNTSIVIGTNPTTSNGPYLLVDGTTITAPQVFVWPVGSKHTVQFPFSIDPLSNPLPYQSAQHDTIRFTFGGWVASNGNFQGTNNSTITITADPSLTSLFANVVETVMVTIDFGQTPVNTNCQGAPGDAPSNGFFGGIIYFDITCYGNTSSFFIPIGAHTLNAFPYPGWVFYGYNAGGQIKTPLATVNVQAPMIITPQFSIAKRVNFLTNPPGLQVLVDGQVINTPLSPASTYTGSCAPDYTRIPPGAPSGFPALCMGEFDFLPGSTHTIGAVSPQQDNLQGTWVFEQYSNGATQNTPYVAGQNTTVADTLIAGFVPGVHVTLYSTPPGLKLMIDGRDNLPGTTFIWGQGDTHQITAESPQTDAKGRVWSFSSWSDGGTQAHTVTVPATNAGLILNAIYAEADQVTVTSSPAGLAFTVDGAACTTPCVLNKPAGGSSQVVAPSSIPNGPGTRYDFTTWSDGSTAATRTVAFTQNTLVLTANYQTSYQLTPVNNPPKGGTFQMSPPSPDGYYASGTQVSITAVPAAGFKFIKWSGDLSGSVNPSSVQVYSPLTPVANYLSAPTISPAGIQSAAGPTADGSVAAGSLISIYGQNLAPALQVGPGNPLAQAIGGTTVTVGSFILPLVFVSPTLINAQVPWELQPGTYNLVVHNTGQPDVPGQFTVSRESPNAFTQPNALQQPLVLALHQDGSAVTFDSPAVRGEQITIYGTGFGPYDQPSIDGFPAPGTTFNLMDPIVLNSDVGPLQPDWAGAASGLVGVAVVQLTIGNNLPSGTNMNLTISVNGRDSMPLVLPLQ
jgi:uncharacterized protein (TIGR03437 family)